MTQGNSDSRARFSDFSDRTDALASHYRIRVSDLSKRIGISNDMLMGYRSGRYPITDKAWRKLTKAETEAGLRRDVDKILRERKLDLDSFPPDIRKAVTAPLFAWGHFLVMIDVLESAVKSRVPFPDPDQESEFQEMLRIYGKHRQRGFEAMAKTRDLAENVVHLLEALAANKRDASSATEAPNLER